MFPWNRRQKTQPKMFFFYKNKIARFTHWCFFKSNFKDASKESCFLNVIIFFVLFWFWTGLSVYTIQLLCTHTASTGLSVYTIHTASRTNIVYILHWVMEYKSLFLRCHCRDCCLNDLAPFSSTILLSILYRPHSCLLLVASSLNPPR